MKITRFEQSAVLIEYQGDVLAVDFGSYSSEESLEAAVGTQPSASLVSHIHQDHMDAANLERIGAPVYSVAQVSSALDGHDVETFSYAAGDTVAVEDTEFSLELVMADHGPNVRERQPDLENVGFCIRAGGKGVWFFGDMFSESPVPTSGFDVVLIPVGNNGYTFDPQAAVDFLKKIDFKGIAVPVHYSEKMHPEAGEEFVKLADGAFETRILTVGDSLQL